MVTCKWYFVELDDVGVPEYFEDAYLAGDSFDVGLLDDLFLLEGFNGHLLLGGDVDAQPHFPEGALPDAFP